jgi:hypothetical protein
MDMKLYSTKMSSILMGIFWWRYHPLQQFHVLPFCCIDKAVWQC